MLTVLEILSVVGHMYLSFQVQILPTTWSTFDSVMYLTHQVLSKVGTSSSFAE